jgi:hypothetical protein
MIEPWAHDVPGCADPLLMPLFENLRSSHERCAFAQVRIEVKELHAQALAERKFPSDQRDPREHSAQNRQVKSNWISR